MQLHKAKMKYPTQIEQKLDSDPAKSSRVSLYSEDFRGEFFNIALEKLIPFSKQARKVFDEESILALANTIKEHGIRQPLTVLAAENQEGVYEIVSGERRFRAAKLLNLATVPCIIIHDRLKAEEIALIENIQRKDLHPIELMNAFQNLLDMKVCHSTQQIADKLGMQKSTVVEILNLKNLPDEIQKSLVEKGIKSRMLFRKLLKSSPPMHEKLINGFMEEKLEIKGIKSGNISKGGKSNIIVIALENNELQVTYNKIGCLSTEQKILLKDMIQNL